MCEPGMIIAGVGLATGIASAGVQYQTQRQYAKAQTEFQNRQYEATALAARQALIRDYADLRARQQEESVKASQEIQAIAKESLRAQTTAFASAGEAGVAGLSLQNLMTDYVQQQSLFTMATQYQQRAVQQQMVRTAFGMQAQAAGRVMGATPQPVSGPSALGAALEAGSSAASWLSLGATREAFGLGKSPKAEVVTGTTGPLGDSAVGGRPMLGGVTAGTSIFG